MEIIVNINGKDTKIVLTAEQVKQVKKQEKLTDRIKTMNDVYSELGIDKSKFESSFMFKEDLYAAKIRLITKVFNQGWEPNWNNSSEYKYYPYFEIKNGGFSYSLALGWSTLTACGSRLSFKLKSDCEYCIKQFEKEFKDNFII